MCIRVYSSMSSPKGKSRNLLKKRSFKIKSELSKKKRGKGGICELGIGGGGGGGGGFSRERN